MSDISDEASRLVELIEDARRRYEREGPHSIQVSQEDMELLRRAGAVLQSEGPQVGGESYYWRVWLEGHSFIHIFLLPQFREETPPGRPS